MITYSINQRDLENSYGKSFMIIWPHYTHKISKNLFRIYRWTSMNYGFALLTDKGVFLNNLSDKQ